MKKRRWIFSYCVKNKNGCEINVATAYKIGIYIWTNRKLWDKNVFDWLSLKINMQKRWFLFIVPDLIFLQVILLRGESNHGFVKSSVSGMPLRPWNSSWTRNVLVVMASRLEHSCWKRKKRPKPPPSDLVSQRSFLRRIQILFSHANALIYSFLIINYFSFVMNYE